MPNFVDTYECDPSAPYHGFKSWDDFFTRSFRSGVRPVQSADNSTLINNPCESGIYCIAYNIKERDSYWLKGEPYSLEDMFNHDELTALFVGGSIC